MPRRTYHFSWRLSRPPSEVRSWWLDFPDVYVAQNPKEQPHKIVTVKTTPEGRELLTYWRGLFGSEMEVHERLMLGAEPSRWQFDVETGRGFLMHDEFEIRPEGTGSRLSIVTTLTAPGLLARLFGWLLLPIGMWVGKRYWDRAVAICDEEGRAQAVTPSADTSVATQQS